jgi:hypothetical protein
MLAEGKRRSRAFPRIRNSIPSASDTADSIRGLWAFTSTRTRIATPARERRERRERRIPREMRSFFMGRPSRVR